MLDVNQEKPVHFPENEDKFEFDHEVSKIFDDMARRSIPMYDEARKLAVEYTLEVIRQRWSDGRTVHLLDIGASTGNFFKDIWDALGYKYHEDIPGLVAVAVDNSVSMTTRMVEEIPGMYVVNLDACEVRKLAHKFDVVYVAYTIQFIKRSNRVEFWVALKDITRPECSLIVSGKERIQEPYQKFYNDTYIQFRKEKGYTIEEIEAKTKALRNAMWVEHVEETVEAMRLAGFSKAQELCRWLQFSTVIATKSGG